MAKSTEAQIVDVEQRLHKVNTELDGLNLGTAPTADLAKEEADALRALCRRVLQPLGPMTDRPGWWAPAS